MGMSNFLETAILNATLRNTSYTSVATVYVALFTALSADGDTVSEVSTSGTGYARVAATFGAPSSGQSTNSAEVAFATALTDWGTITHVGIYDASTAGNLLYWAETDQSCSRQILTGQVWRLPTGELAVSID